MYIADNAMPVLMRHGRTEALWQLIGEDGIVIEDTGVSKFPETMRSDPRYQVMLSRGRESQKKAFDILETAREQGEFPEYLEDVYLREAKAYGSHPR